MKPSMNSPTGSAVDAAMATVFPDRTKLLGRIVTGRAASIGLADATRSFPAVGALRRTAALMTPRTANIRCWSRLGATRCGASTLRRHVTARDLSGARRARHAKVQNRSDRGASFIARSAMPPRKKPPTPGSGGKGRQLGLFESFQRDTPSKRRRRSVLSRATIAADILSNSNAHHASSEPLTSSPLNLHPTRQSGPPAETSTWNTASPGPDTTPSPSSSSRPRAAEAGSTHSARTRKTPDDPKQSSSPRSTSYSATSATRSRRTTSTSASSPSSSARASS